MVRILPITWTRVQLQRRHGNITTYAQELIERNFRRSIDVDKEDVVHNWWLLVDRLFPKDDSERGKWMSQSHSPGFHEFWVERDSQNGIHEQLDNEGFQRAKRPTTRAEIKNHPGAVYLTKNGIETLIPGVDFTALKNVNYRFLVRNILEANPTRQIALPEMQLLWDAVVYRIFRFECSCAKEAKLNESTGAERFSQEQYSQLVLDVRNGAPPPKPRLLVTLPIPGYKRRRETSSTDDSSEFESDVGAEEKASPTLQARIQKRRSKRRHRSGPGSDVSVPGYPYVSSAHRSAPIAQGQPLLLPDTFARPSTGPRSTSAPEGQWLDLQLVNGLALQANGEAVEGSVGASTVLGLEEADNAGGPYVHEEKSEEEVGAWSL